MKAVFVGDDSFFPSKILCVGRNYVEHINELGNEIPENMVVFNKPNSSIASELYSYLDEPLHYEAEICFLVRNQQLYAVGFGLDLTKRSLQSKLKQKGLPWERAKAFDNSAKFSRFIPLSDMDVSELEVELFINSMRMQLGGTKQMLYKPDVILQELASYTELQDGDIVMTGTPQGVGEIVAGDRFLGRIKYAGRAIVEVEWLAI
ncbi:fumarylacetoacetate hydrolase family protein [Vibrio barjaei]|uniref:fumarylacetoacetate hydrolase family protein n=1 Tax=Vibrio barjaei TaxID=1676683 RepID=UPI0007BBDD20|nr:fumarylacetoacetate hydrolase family protein [Vibrio barjaei]MCG9789204.1 fumarylacetoacetate hydrolase family protein [Vibrio mediterranei]MCY9870972.1 fumarylacetoacetate hydrolase family protein [Vibrio barjaei]OIN24302.1 2-keto-4-pentenoate hydratase [Vibrio barjaei]